MIRFGEKLQVVPLLSPQDTTEVTLSTPFVDVSLAHWLTLLVKFGNVAGDSLVLVVEASTENADSGTEAGVAFKYRQSSAVGTDAWGAVSDGAATGISINASQDNTSFLIEVDPADVAAALTGGKFVRVRLVPGSSSMSALLVNADAFLEPVYPGLTPISSS